MTIKTFFLSICLPVLVITSGCGNDRMDDIKVPDTDTGISASGKIRTVDEAVEIAGQAAELFGRRSEVSRSHLSASSARVHVVGSAKSRSGEPSDTLLYVVDYGDNAGFAVISAPYGTEALLAVTEKGDFGSMETIQNPGFQYYMDAARSYAAAATSLNAGGSAIITPAEYTIYQFVNDEIEPKVKVEWGQRYPEGIFCPNGICGCVQTALAQIFSYFEEPLELNLTYPERELSKISLQWDDLKKHIRSTDYGDDYYGSHMAMCDATEQSHIGLGILCRELGHRNSAIYMDFETLVFGDQIPRRTCRDILINHQVDEIENYISADDFYNGLKEGIAYFSGSSSENAVGHAWVADGGRVVGKKIYYYSNYEKDPETGKDVLLRVVDNTSTYFHFNWGWNGYCNGYFDAGVFAVDKGAEYDNPDGNYGGYNFNSRQKYFIIK